MYTVGHDVQAAQFKTDDPEIRTLCLPYTPHSRSSYNCIFSSKRSIVVFRFTTEPRFLSYSRSFIGFDAPLSVLLVGHVFPDLVARHGCSCISLFLSALIGSLSSLAPSHGPTVHRISADCSGHSAPFISFSLLLFFPSRVKGWCVAWPFSYVFNVFCFASCLDGAFLCFVDRASITP